jgi:amino acid transporter
VVAAEVRGATRAAAGSRKRLRPDLNLFDFTLLVIGAVIGADIYVVAADRGRTARAGSVGGLGLSYALAKDGLFPHPFARLHHQFGTPYVGLAFQALAALAFANVLDLTNLIDGAMFFLGDAARGKRPRRLPCCDRKTEGERSRSVRMLPRRRRTS